MLRISHLKVLGIATACLLSTHALGAVKITGVNFRGDVNPNTLEIAGDGPLTFDKQENPADNQVILEISNAQISKGVARKIDTSSFKSNISLISPYQVPGKDDTVRIVIQLRAPTDVEASAEGNSIKISVPQNGSPDTPPAEVTSGESIPPAAVPAADTPSAPAAAAAESQTDRTRLDEFAESQATKKYIGKPITLNFREVELTDVFRLIGEASGFNIILSGNLNQKVTLSLVDVPWDQALDLILQTHKLGAERNNNILRITTLQELTEEKTAQLNATKATQATAPRVTRLFPISYAKLADLQVTLSKFASASGSGSDSLVQIDDRTNSILVRDTAENIDKMKKLIELLDTQTPQVLIEAKVIEATESFAKNIGGNLGFSNKVNVMPHFASFSGNNPLDPLLGTGGVFSGSTIAAASTGAGTFGLSPDLSLFSNNMRLNAALSMGEAESQVKVIASPKTVVMNKASATIVQGTPVALPTTTISAGVTTTAYTIEQANLSLEVMPTVTNDGSILMQLKISRDVPVSLTESLTAIGNRNINTTVLVESGSTLSIGGIYTLTEDESSSGFPWLRKIPIVGWLFGSERKRSDKSELFIFITPRILNPKEAGMSSNNG